jgi:CRISPR-associated endonuclease/helicase Cas3
MRNGVIAHETPDLLMIAGEFFIRRRRAVIEYDHMPVRVSQAFDVEFGERFCDRGRVVVAHGRIGFDFYDLAGNDIDVSRFIRDGRDLDVQVFWRRVGENEAPKVDDDSGRKPSRRELCAVPLMAFREEFLRKRGGRAFRWDHLDGRWVRAFAGAVFPGQLYLVPSGQGGYSPDVGWNPKSTQPVEILPANADPPEAYDGDEHVEGAWQAISDHTDEVVAWLGELVGGLGLDGDIGDLLLLAARWHDVGKAHRVFQDEMTRHGPPKEGLWAKAPGRGPARYARKGFRHELASALTMLQTGHPELACYLAAAHHGKVRLSIRSLPNEKRPGDKATRFARGVWDGDEMPATDLGGGEGAPAVSLSLEPMELGLSADGKPSWAERMLSLRDDPQFGPFRLAYLEALLRAADMRASAAHSRKEAGRA